MAEQVKAHETSVSLVKAALAELDAGADIALKVKVACTSACDLQGRKVKIIDQDAVAAKEIELVTFDGAANETDEFVVKAPNKPGGYLWTAQTTSALKPKQRATTIEGPWRNHRCKPGGRFLNAA